MTPREFYSEEVLEKSRRLFATIETWGRPRNDVNLLGGWAVKAMVQGFAMDSRDVDLLLKTLAAFESFKKHMADWGLVWRRRGRTVYKECHFKGQEPFPPIVDVFTAESSIGAELFTTLAATNVKAPQGPAWLPPLPALVRDKILTVPLRTSADKFAKDLLDVWSLVFHNRAGQLPADLLGAANLDARIKAAGLVKESRVAFPQFGARFDAVHEWLLRRPKL